MRVSASITLPKLSAEQIQFTATDTPRPILPKTHRFTGSSPRRSNETGECDRQRSSPNQYPQRNHTQLGKRQPLFIDSRRSLLVGRLAGHRSTLDRDLGGHRRTGHGVRPIFFGRLGRDIPVGHLETRHELEGPPGLDVLHWSFRRHRCRLRERTPTATRFSRNRKLRDRSTEVHLCGGESTRIAPIRARGMLICSGSDPAAKPMTVVLVGVFSGLGFAAFENLKIFSGCDISNRCGNRCRRHPRSCRGRPGGDGPDDAASAFASFLPCRMGGHVRLFSGTSSISNRRWGCFVYCWPLHISRPYMGRMTGSHTFSRLWPPSSLRRPTCCFTPMSRSCVRRLPCQISQNWLLKPWCRA